MAGGAYAFSRVETEWLFQGAFDSEPTLRAGDAFGHAVAIDGDVAVVTAPGDGSMDRDGNTIAVAAVGEDGDGTEPSDDSLPSSRAVYIFR